MTVTERPRLPFARSNVLELAPMYEVLRRQAPVTAVTTPAGDPAWLVTGFTEVRWLLADPRLGRSHPDPANAARMSTAAVQGGPEGDYETEEADHTRMRRLLTPSFSAKRMRLLSGQVQELVDGYLDRLIAEHDASADGMVDLYSGLALPLPVEVICRLLGVPEVDSGRLRALSDRMASFSDDGDAHRGFEEFGRYMAALAETKRAEPGEDVISDLVQAQADDGQFDHAEMVRLAVVLLFAGHETTVNRIGLGVLLLLTLPEHWDALITDPAGRVDDTVEEILRWGAPGALGLLRYARTDIEIGGVTIGRGDAVVLSTNAANRDPSVFAEAETFNPGRVERTHLGFGYGGRFCIGASLARTELRIVFETLARRLPGLRLATGLDQFQVRTDHVTGSVTSLPVTW
jgi:cytochrome P450